MERARRLTANSRKSLIAAIEKNAEANVLSIVTGDRQGMETRLAPDVLPLVAEHLSRMGRSEKVALFLYTPGGDSIAGWGLVNLIRQYCSEFSVLVPFRALSCGTLIAMGADEVAMGIHGLLSPIDPSVASPFNPQAPVSQQGAPVNLLPVSVEDMIGFLDLARNEGGLKSEQSLVEVLKLLATHVHPLALGAVYRAREQNSSLAKRLLSAHIEDEGKIERIVGHLTRELPTHSYLIGREEAREDLELPIAEVDEELDGLMWALYKEYEAWLKLTQPASAERDSGDLSEETIRYARAVIESLHEGSLMQHVFVTEKAIVKLKVTSPGTDAPVDQIAERIRYQGWESSVDGEAIT